MFAKLSAAMSRLTDALLGLVVKNVRYGFATNSSSSHSLVYLSKPIPGHDTLARTTDAEFGWEDFRLASLRDKLFYLLVQRVGQSGFWGEDKDERRAEAIRRAVVDHWDAFPELTYDDFVEAVDGYVDHQSRGTLDEARARDPHVVVFGGNDNGGDSSLRAAQLHAGGVDWTKTVPQHDEEDRHLPPALRHQRCANCTQPVYRHTYWCGEAPCDICRAPAGGPHGEGCTLGKDAIGAALPVAACESCSAERYTPHKAGCFWATQPGKHIVGMRGKTQ